MSYINKKITEERDSLENFPYFVRNLNPTLYVTQLHNLLKVQQQTYFYKNLQNQLYTNEEKTRILIEIRKLKSDLQEIKASIKSLKKSQRDALADGTYSETLMELNRANQELIDSMEEDIRDSENKLNQLQLQFQKSDQTSLDPQLSISESDDSQTKTFNLNESNNNDFIVQVDESSSFTESSEEEETLLSGDESSSSDESSSDGLDGSDEESSSSIESSVEDENLLSDDESSSSDESSSGGLDGSDEESSSSIESSVEEETLLSDEESSSSDESSSGGLDGSDDESSSSIESSMEEETLLSDEESSSSDVSSSGGLDGSDDESSSSIESSVEEETLLSDEESSSSDVSSNVDLNDLGEKSSSSFESSMEDVQILPLQESSSPGISISSVLDDSDNQSSSIESRAEDQASSIGHEVSVDDFPSSIETSVEDEQFLPLEDSSSSGEYKRDNYDKTEQEPFSFIETSIEDEPLSLLDEYNQINKDDLHEEASSSQSISFHPIESVLKNEKNPLYTINPIEDPSDTSNVNGISGERQEENSPFQNKIISLPEDFQVDKQEVSQNPPISTEDLEIKGHDNPELTEVSFSSPNSFNLYEETTEEKLGFISLFKSLPSNYPVRSIITNGTEVYVSFFIHYDPNQKLVYFSDSENVMTIECSEINGITFAGEVDCESYD